MTQPTWSLLKSAIQYGTAPATIVVEGLGAGEVLAVKITCPDNSNFKLELEADMFGFVQTEVHLLSGTGEYRIELWADSCAETPQCYTLPPLVLVASPCKVDDANPVLELFCSQPNIPVGGSVELTVLGAPNRAFVISHSYAGGMLPHTGLTNIEGLASLSIPVVGLSDTFIAMQGTLVSQPVVTRTPADVNSPALVASAPVTAKRTGIKVAVVPSSLALEQNIVFPLTVQIQNTSDEDIRLSLAPVAGTLKLEVPNYLNDEPIAAGATREFTFFVSGNHTEAAAYPLDMVLEGSYTPVSAGATPLPAAETVTISMPARMLATSLVVTAAVLRPASIALGDTTVLSVTVQNQGEAAVTGVTLPPVHFTDTLGALGFDNVTIPQGHSYTSTAVLRPTAKATYLYTIDGAAISGMVQGNVVVAEGSWTTSCVVS